MYGDCEILRYVMPTCLSAASAIIIKLKIIHTNGRPHNVPAPLP